MDADKLDELERLWASSGFQNGELYAEGGALMFDNRYLYDIGHGEAEQGGDLYQLASMNPEDAALIAAAINALPELVAMAKELDAARAELEKIKSAARKYEEDTRVFFNRPASGDRLAAALAKDAT